MYIIYRHASVKKPITVWSQESNSANRHCVWKWGIMADIVADKVVVVTGGANGIGREIAITAVRSGAKAALVGDITEDSREAGYLVRATPGVADATDFVAGRTPLRRLGRVDEIANTVMWLASDLSSFISAQIIAANGGYLAAF